MITKTERQELRGVVRNQFRVLRKEVEQRMAEMIADGEQQILDRFHDADVRRAEIDEEVDYILRRALDEIRQVCKDRPDAGVPKRLNFTSGWVSWAPDRRGELRAALYSNLRAKADGAKLTLERQEADVLRNLAVGALESDEARAFLGTIPTVAELVPSVRLAELEAQFDGDA